MRVDWQQQFVEQWFSEDRYAAFLQILDQRVGTHVEFRVCEAPVFLSQQMRAQLARFAVEIAVECAKNRAVAEQALPPQYRVPGESSKPLFIVVDFALAEEAGKPTLKVVELQGFPSLYGYQYELAKAYQEAYSLPDMAMYYTDLTDATYWEIVRQAVVGEQDPREVALVELHPWKQKTLPDFTALQKHLGIAIVDIVDVVQQGKRLYYRDDRGRLVPIRRIMNRAIIEEMESAGVGIPPWWTQPVEVEWAGHPNWYFWMSKYILPYLRHPAVPSTLFLDQLQTLPEDLSRYVLKPLYAFAGKGVKVAVTEADIAAIPKAERAQYILQEKIRYFEWMPTPYGKNKTELRVLLIWEEAWEEPKPLIPLVRTGRAAMMGVSYNEMPWGGSSTALFPTA